MQITTDGSYSLQALKSWWNHDGELIDKQWAQIECFQDKELAEKELENLRRRWPASGVFRLVKNG